MASDSSVVGLRIPAIQSLVSCAVVFAVSYHVIRRRVMFGGFAGDENIFEPGWSAPVIVLTLISIAIFAATLLVLMVELSGRESEVQQRRLKWLISFQCLAIFFLFSVSPESATVFASLCLARIRRFYSWRVSVQILGMMFLAFVAILVRNYGNTLGYLGVAICSILVLGFYLFTLVHSHNAVREAELRKEATRLNRELLSTRELLAQSSRQQERLRIARNIHDLLGHQLTGLVLNLEIAGHVSEGKAKPHIASSHALAKGLLGDLRDAVSGLRESASLDFNHALSEIVGNISELEVTATVEEGLVIGNAETAETLIRCIQEALTNVRKHARARQCEVGVFRKGGDIVLRVTDDGSVRDPIEPGNGLLGMQERIQAISGSLAWGNRDGSFFLEASLPARVI